MENVKSYKEFVNGSASFDYASAKNDLEELKFGDSKKQIAQKYGIQSNKTSDIEKGIYDIGNEVRKAKHPNEYTDDDFMWWWRCFNAPTTAVTLKKALDGEYVEWCSFILKKADELIFNKHRGDYWERAKRSFDKYVGGLVNKSKNDSDPRFTSAVATLMEETKEFHDRYIESVKTWSEETFDTHLQFKDFSIYDFMCFFGTTDRETTALVYEHEKNPIQGIMYVVRKLKNGKWFSPISTEYIPKKKTVKYRNRTLEAVPIRKGDNDYRKAFRDGANLLDRSKYADLPSKTAFTEQALTTEFAVKYKWNKEKFVSDMVDSAQKRYERDMLAVAEKIRKMNIDEENMKVSSIFPDAKHYDITVTDGKRSVHARSIFAAEFSEYVSPHYRFIIT